MTVAAAEPRVRAHLVQFLMLLSINVPTVSFGLAMGWVSLASGESGESEASEAGDSWQLVLAAAATFAAGVLGVPLGARALRYSRRAALAATSAAFAVSWSLTLAGGWWLVCGRLCAGVAGAAAWTLAPILGAEMCPGAARAASCAPVVAHNLGMLLMYLAGLLRLQHRAVVTWCVVLSALHAGAALLAAESPAYLASHSRHKEAARWVACLHGVEVSHPSVAARVTSLPSTHHHHRPLMPAVREMLSEPRRRRAFLIALLAVVGQEACGVLTLLQFAERVFLLAGERDGAAMAPAAGEGQAARRALVLGAVQFVAAAAALWLVERVSRKPLLVWCGVVAGAGLALGAAGVQARADTLAGAALAAAVAGDSLGLQPVPYVLLHDVLPHTYRGCGVVVVMVSASAANAAEMLVFPAVVRTAGLTAALALAATLTLLYALLAILYVPETKDRTLDQIYDDICPQIKLNEETAPGIGEIKLDVHATVNIVTIKDASANNDISDMPKRISLGGIKDGICLTSNGNEETEFDIARSGKKFYYNPITLDVQNINRGELGDDTCCIVDSRTETVNEIYNSETDIDSATKNLENINTNGVNLKLNLKYDINNRIINAGYLDDNESAAAKDGKNNVNQENIEYLTVIESNEINTDNLKKETDTKFKLNGNISNNSNKNVRETQITPKQPNEETNKIIIRTNNTSNETGVDDKLKMKIHKTNAQTAFSDLFTYKVQPNDKINCKTRNTDTGTEVTGSSVAIQTLDISDKCFEETLCTKL